MKNYTLINSDGTETTKYILELDEMQSFVGGNLERVGNIICNDNGIRLNLPRNTKYPNFIGNIIIENR